MKAIKYNLPQNGADVKKQVKSAKTSITGMKNKVQHAAVGIIYHASKHGDYSQANELVSALGNGINGKSLVKWFVTFGLILDKPEKGQKSKGFVDFKGMEYLAKHLETAKETLWYDTIKQPSAFKEYDANEAIKRVFSERQRMTAKLAELSDEQRAKVNVILDAQTLKLLWDSVDFTPIVQEAIESGELIVDIKEEEAA